MFSRKNVIAAGYIVACAVMALALAALLDFPHSRQHWSADLVTARFSPSHKSQDDRIALVYVTEETISRFTYTAPTDRQMLADLVTKIDSAGADVIGLDFIFDHKTETAKDKALADAIRNAKAKVILGRIGGGTKSDTTEGFEKEFLAATARPAGHLYFDEHRAPFVISDEAIRGMAAKIAGTSITDSFAEALAEAALAKPTKSSREIAWIRAPGDGTETFPTLNADTVLDVDGKAPTGLVKNILAKKIVLVGGNFFDRDQHLIPFSVLSHTRYPGLFVHAQILSQFLEKRNLYPIGRFGSVILAALAAAIGFFAGRWSGNRFMLVEFATALFLIVLGILTFVLGGLIFPYTMTLLAWVAGAASGHYSEPERRGE